MQIQINPGSVTTTSAIESHISDRVQHSLKTLLEEVTRVEVHLHDDDGRDRKGELAKRVTMEARPRGGDPIVVHATGRDLYEVVSDAAGKLERAVRRFTEKRRDRSVS